MGPSGNTLRQLRWLLPALLILALVGCFTVEPMRWQLPPRYWFKPLDIHRTGSGDFTMCMRAALSPEEAGEFVENQFGAKEHVARTVPMDQTMCPAPFWPRWFTASTLGYSVEYLPNGDVEGSTGAVYENGYLYFWSNTM